jgi:aquaporin TIP
MFRVRYAEARRTLRFAAGKFRSLRLSCSEVMAAFRTAVDTPLTASAEHGVGTIPRKRSGPSEGRRSLCSVETDVLRRAAAEFVGAFTLIFIGAGSIMAAGLLGERSIVPIALAHGLAIAVMVSAVGHISGGHFNPAITLGFVVTRRIEPVMAGAYWAAQFVGAVIAALLLKWIFPKGAIDPAHLGAPALNSAIGSGGGVVLEAIMTFLLVWVVFATAVDPRGTFKAIAGLAIGLTITLDVCAGGVLTGAAMNPARAFGPQLVDNFWDDGWIWYVGPAAGGVVAALAYEWLYLRPPQPEPVGPPETGVREPRPGETAAD